MLPYMSKVASVDSGDDSYGGSLLAAHFKVRARIAAAILATRASIKNGLYRRISCVLDYWI